MKAAPNVSGGLTRSDNPWEKAYLRFETPEEEIRKFTKRLVSLGANDWPRSLEVVELFCGRGNGLHALTNLGFKHIEGVDLSERLVQEYRGTARCYISDCRTLPFANQSKDVLIIQGGLHHLECLPAHLEQCLDEMRRVLRKNGRVVLVEPWLTLFLRFVHVMCERPMVRRCSDKLDALATMIQYERNTYEQWLGHAEMILALVHLRFNPTTESFGWGKWRFVGAPRTQPMNHGHDV